MATNGVWERTPYLFGGGHEAEEHMNTFSNAVIAKKSPGVGESVHVLFRFVPSSKQIRGALPNPIRGH